MPVVNGPPSSSHVFEWRISLARLSTLEPRLVGANKMHHVDAGLEVSVRRHVLVMRRGCDIVGEADAVVRILEVHVEETLVGTIERNASLCHCHKRIVVSHVGAQNHYTSIEKIRPSDIGCGREGRGDVE